MRLKFGDVLEWYDHPLGRKLVIFVIGRDGIGGEGYFRCLRLTDWAEGMNAGEIGTYPLQRSWGDLSNGWTVLNDG